MKTTPSGVVLAGLAILKLVDTLKAAAKVALQTRIAIGSGDLGKGIKVLLALPRHELST